MLNENGYFEATVHCAYYCCVQLMLHILRADFGKSDKLVDKESRKGSRIAGGFHNWLLKQILKDLIIRNPESGKMFNSTIGALKKMRIKADYKNLPVDADNAGVSIQLAEKILDHLNNEFRT